MSRGPVAAYAAILDGRHLWLAIDAMPGTLSVRDPDTGDLVPLAGEPADTLTHRSVRADLTQLPTPAMPETSYDVVLKTSKLRPARPVWTPPLPPRAPMRFPPAPDGVTQFLLDRDEEGHLRVLRRSLPQTAELTAIDQGTQGVHLTIRPPDDVQPGTHLLLLDTEDELLGTLPVTGHEGQLGALVAVDDLPPGYFGVIRFAVGTAAAWVRIRRQASDLSDPNHAVLLPELFDLDDTDTDLPRARFRWSPDSLLAARVIDPSEPAP